MKLSEINNTRVVLYENNEAGDDKVLIYLEINAKNSDRIIYEGSKQSLNIGTVSKSTAKKLDSYYANKRRTTRFFANCIDTRKLYKKIIKDLTATGKYKVLRSVWVDGGLMWDLERVK